MHGNEHLDDNVASIIDRAAADAPDRVALIVDDADCTYGDLAPATARWVATLADAGIGASDRIALVDWAGVRDTAVTLAAAHLGAATAHMNPLLTPTELATLVEVSGGARVAVADADAASAIGQALGPNGTVLERPAESPGATPARRPGGDSPALVLFTSGTTGVPKPVPISHAALLARVSAYRPPYAMDRPPNVSLMCVPSFHVGGILGLLLSLWSGDTTVLLPRFDAGRWLAAVERHQVASAFVVPTMLARILDHPDLATTDTSSLRTISYGAAAAPVELVERAMAHWPETGFANVFGQTETLGAYTSLTPADHRDPTRIGSVGRPLPGIELQVIDPDSGAPVAEGNVGELHVRATQNVVSDGWFATGDLARIDADGYVFPAGRRSDTINRGGEKFGPAEVADAVRAHPSVADVVVAGIPDPEMGERVGAAIVLHRALDDFTLDELRASCSRTLAPFKLPEVLVIVDRLPYNDVGKIPRRVAVELIASGGHRRLNRSAP